MFEPTRYGTRKYRDSQACRCLKHFKVSVPVARGAKYGLAGNQHAWRWGLVCLHEMYASWHCQISGYAAQQFRMADQNWQIFSLSHSLILEKCTGIEETEIEWGLARIVLWFLLLSAFDSIFKRGRQASCIQFPTPWSANVCGMYWGIGGIDQRQLQNLWIPRSWLRSCWIISTTAFYHFPWMLHKSQWKQLNMSCLALSNSDLGTLAQAQVQRTRYLHVRAVNRIRTTIREHLWLL